MSARRIRYPTKEPIDAAALRRQALGGRNFDGASEACHMGKLWRRAPDVRLPRLYGRQRACDSVLPLPLPRQAVDPWRGVTKNALIGPEKSAAMVQGALGATPRLGGFGPGTRRVRALVAPDAIELAQQVRE
jgi:hypothetical protein